MLLLALAPTAPATAAGELDTTFSGDGKLVSDFGTRNDGAGDVAVQRDGKIVVATGSGLEDPARKAPAGRGLWAVSQDVVCELGYSALAQRHPSFLAAFNASFARSAA